MNRLLELTSKLTPEHVKEVEDFVQFLLARQPTVEAKGTKYLDVDSFAGMFAGLAPEKSAVELADEAKLTILQKYGSGE